jgi:SAM-dependent methyltransferase
MHPGAYRFVARTLRRFPPRRCVVELGSYNVNGSVRDLFAGAAYTGVDLRPGPGVDVVGDATDPRIVLWFLGNVPDCVVTTETLEHATDPGAVVRNAHGMLAPGGLLIVTAASPARPPHGIDGGAVAGEHYGAIDPDDLRSWLRPFRRHEVIEDVAAGDVYAWATK